MAAKTVVCPECGETLPHGRLACPSCGTLVASVGAPRRVDPAPPAAPDVDRVPEAPPSAPASSAKVAPRRRAAPPVLQDWDGAIDVAHAATVDDAPPEPSHDTTFAAEVAGPFVAAGAYLPPSAHFATPVTDAVTRPAEPSERSGRPGQVSLLSDLPFDAPEDLPGWFVAVGAGLGMVAFLVPWAPNVIGAAGTRAWIDTWGLAAPMHLPLFALVIGTLALGIVPNPVPSWVRAGIFPLVLGGLLLGLIWPYLVGPLGGQFGSVGVAVAGILLAVGGTLEIAGHRHAADVPVVEASGPS